LTLDRDPKTLEPTNHEMKPLKLWAKNIPLHKMTASGIHYNNGKLKHSSTVLFY
jgi:hypothetical protein